MSTVCACRVADEYPVRRRLCGAAEGSGNGTGAPLSGRDAEVALAREQKRKMTDEQLEEEEEKRAKQEKLREEERREAVEEERCAAMVRDAYWRVLHAVHLLPSHSCTVN